MIVFNLYAGQYDDVAIVVPYRALESEAHMIATDKKAVPKVTIGSISATGEHYGRLTIPKDIRYVADIDKEGPKVTATFNVRNLTRMFHHTEIMEVLRMIAGGDGMVELALGLTPKLPGAKTPDLAVYRRRVRWQGFPLAAMAIAVEVVGRAYEEACTRRAWALVDLPDFAELMATCIADIDSVDRAAQDLSFSVLRRAAEYAETADRMHKP